MIKLCPVERVNLEDNYKTSLEKTAQVLKAGGLVVFPSDTVYGLVVNARNKKAVEKLLAFKERWLGKAISVAVSDKKMAADYVEFNKDTVRIYDKLLPGPFTIISKGKHKLAAGIEAENGTLGIRIPEYRAIRDLVKMMGGPITVTSANLSGRSPHYSIESFLNTLSEKKMVMLDLIVDGGKLPKKKPSTVIDASEGELKILRRGDLITGKTETLISKSEEETGRVAEFLLKKWGEGRHQEALVFGLSGDLGCGKTVFARSMARILGVKEKITSPTFIIYNEYRLDGAMGFEQFLHFDLYRIRETYELQEINFLELFGNKTVACIEWPENMGKEYFEKLKKKVNYIPVEFGYIDQTSREIKY